MAVWLRLLIFKDYEWLIEDHNLIIVHLLFVLSADVIQSQSVGGLTVFHSHFSHVECHLHFRD